MLDDNHIVVNKACKHQTYYTIFNVKLEIEYDICCPIGRNITLNFT